MNSNKLIKDISFAFVAQGLNIVVNILISLLLPKVLGVAQFGYWQLFIFYFGYVGFFHLGINDGIYLINGGVARSQIDKRSISSQFFVSVTFQLIVSALVFLAACLGPFEESRSFVIASVSIMLVINNSALFLGFVFQAMNETPLFSMSAVFDSASFFIGLVLLILFGINYFQPYVILFILAKAVRLVYCLYKSRDIFAKGLYPIKKSLALSCKSIRVGMKLMVANIASTLILGTVRFFVDLNWGIKVFSIVSFSLSITTFFLMFLSQVSMVLFPNLKQMSSDKQRKLFPILRDGLDLLLPLVYVLYGPAVVVLTMWVPEYAQSIQMFSLLFPICVFDGKMDIVGSTFYKVLRKEKDLLRLNLTTCAASIGATLIGTYVFHSVELVLLFVVIILGARSALAECVISRDLGIQSSALGFAAILVSLLFIALSRILPAISASIAFLFVYMVYLLIFNKKINALFKAIKK